MAKKGRRATENERIQAVQLIERGRKIHDVADIMGVSRSAVLEWWEKYRRGGLDALTDGVEQRIDLGVIGGRTFVNNASFGAYAEIVESPAYRDDKRGTTLAILPDILSGHRGAMLSVRADAVTVSGPQALLVSNNAYEMTDIAGLGHRARLDTGTLGVVAVTVDSAVQAVELLGGRGVTTLAASEVVGAKATAIGLLGA